MALILTHRVTYASYKFIISYMNGRSLFSMGKQGVTLSYTENMQNATHMPWLGQCASSAEPN